MKERKERDRYGESINKGREREKEDLIVPLLFFYCPSCFFSSFFFLMLSLFFSFFSFFYNPAARTPAAVFAVGLTRPSSVGALLFSRGAFTAAHSSKEITPLRSVSSFDHTSLSNFSITSAGAPTFVKKIFASSFVMTPSLLASISLNASRGVCTPRGCTPPLLARGGCGCAGAAKVIVAKSATKKKKMFD